MSDESSQRNQQLGFLPVPWWYAIASMFGSMIVVAFYGYGQPFRPNIEVLAVAAFFGLFAPVAARWGRR